MVQHCLMNNWECLRTFQSCGLSYVGFFTRTTSVWECLLELTLYFSRSSGSKFFRYPPSQTLGLRGLWRMFPALKGGLCGTIYRPHFTILAEVVGELQQHALGDSERCRLNRAQGITTGRKERCFHYVVPL